MLHPRNLAVITALLLFAPHARAAAADPYLPEDTERVINLNVRQLLDSKLVKKNLLELAQEALRGNDEVQDILKDLGFDPFKDLDRILIAAPGAVETDRGLLIVHGRFDVAKFKAKGEQVAKDHSEHLKVHKILGDKHLLYEVNHPDRDEPFFVALAGRDTLLVAAGKDYIVDALKKSKDPTKPILKNKKFQALLDKLDADQSLSLAAVASPDIKKAIDKAPGDIKGMVEKVQALGGGATITDEVKLELVVTTKNNADAKDLRDSVRAGLDAILGFAALIVQNNNSPEAELLVEFIKSLRATNKGDAVIVKGRINSDVIEDMLKKKSK